MADAWYLVARGPAPSLDIWPLGTDPDAVDGYVQAASAILGIPADWDGLSGGWDLQVSQGTPHPGLLAQATTVHDTPPAA